jgi:SAM-dependent methyltransferase
MLTSEVRAFVRANLPPPPARVLEVGAGSGELARALTGAGYDVVAIDPEPGGDNVHRVPLAEVAEPPGSFDAAVAVLSLHHVDPLVPSCERLAELVRPAGILVVDEFDIAEFDERAASWWLHQRHARGESEDSEPSALVDDLRSELHSAERIREVLGASFEVSRPLRGSYLHRWDLDESLRPLEEELIAQGELPAVGVRFVAVRAG